jgi:hypothetical protein
MFSGACSFIDMPTCPRFVRGTRIADRLRRNVEEPHA